jgi:hypothetical protein
MSWFTGLNTSEIVSRDRSFRVALRPNEHGELRQFDVAVDASAMWRMAAHGPIGPVLNAHVINEAKKLAPDGHGWWGDVVQETTAQ